MRISLDHAHIFASDISATIDFLTRMFGATVVWDEEAAGTRNVRMAIGPDNLLIELFQSREPERWKIAG